MDYAIALQTILDKVNGELFVANDYIDIIGEIRSICEDVLTNDKD